MFTGIVTDIGRVAAIEPLDQGNRLKVETSYNTATIEIGASIAHAGVCLTVVSKGDGWFETEAWEEALRLTTLGSMNVGAAINLERSLKIGDELGGHLVTGHIDGTAEITAIEDEGAARRYLLEAPDALAPFIAQKGSIALDGTSLTVNKVDGNRFDVLLIHHTLEVTTWGERTVTDRVNLEVDLMARYAARRAGFDA